MHIWFQSLRTFCKKKKRKKEKEKEKEKESASTLLSDIILHHN
jgi:hypothetical protein